MVELRLEITKMSNYAAIEHKIYKEVRSIKAKINLENRLPTKAEQERLDELEKLAKQGYVDVWQQILKDNK